ncbi:MAG: PQQ-dependent sugar dehydrogenase, partial [Devosia sp.]|nr:PQQ-dependent sugar dehydrogenase [Devosia sp.]
MRRISPNQCCAVTIGLLSLGVAMPATAQTVESSAGPLTATILTEGLDHPWALGFLPDGRMLVTERTGQLRIIDDGEVSAPIEGVPEVYSQGQGGLLDLALAPDFATSGRIYLTFAERAEDAGKQRGQGTAVYSARLVLDGQGGRLEDGEVIFRMNRFTTTNRHFGSRAGAIVRIAPDGSVPEDNPKTEGWAPELWSKGHRNPQGATLRPSDGALFTVEHGARGGDEVNMPKPGGNYGWPVITYGVDYSGAPIGEGTEKPGLEQPLHYWDPSVSPSGLDFYEGELLP